MSTAKLDALREEMDADDFEAFLSDLEARSERERD